jgi:hypothetical protein
VVTEDEVERYQEFHDHVSADDFESGSGPQS